MTKKIPYFSLDLKSNETVTHDPRVTARVKNVPSKIYAGDDAPKMLQGGTLPAWEILRGYVCVLLITLGPGSSDTHTDWRSCLTAQQIRILHYQGIKLHISVFYTWPVLV